MLTAQFLVVVIVVVVLQSSLLFFFLKRSDRIAGDWSCIFDPLSCRCGRHSLLATRHRSNRTKGRCNFCWIILELLLTMTTTTSDNPKLARFRQLVADKRSQQNGDEGSTPMSGNVASIFASGLTTTCWGLPIGSKNLPPALFHRVVVYLISTANISTSSSITASPSSRDHRRHEWSAVVKSEGPIPCPPVIGFPGHFPGHFPGCVV